VIRTLGNSGAPRWYDTDLRKFPEYLDLLEQCGATGAEIVLYDGDADEFTSRVHVVRPDWEQVIRGYRDRSLWLSIHGPLTPEFSPLQWRDEPERTRRRYQPILDQVSELAQEQGATTLVLHALTDPSRTLEQNERDTAAFLCEISNELGRRSGDVTVAIELRAFRDSRSTAAGTTRESVRRVVEQVNHPGVGICWDLAHDLESRIALGLGWEEPDTVFLSRVRHLHLHDLGPNDEPHYPPIVGRVRNEVAFEHLEHLPAVMEVRWRMAERLGHPWDVLRRSYQAIQERSRA
jgi:sugar phosphate isomerase/epimerase